MHGPSWVFRANLTPFALKDKMEYTWSKFMPGCFAMAAASMQELEMKKFCKELLAEA